LSRRIPGGFAGTPGMDADSAGKIADSGVTGNADGKEFSAKR